MPLKLNKRFRRAALGIAIGASISANERTGYNGFDFLGAEFNLACAIDPTCRKLTEEEIELAREYFGNDVDYSTVNYFDRAPMWNFRGRENTIAVSSLGNIFEVSEEFYDNASDTEKDNVFLHEMLHVWQWQHGYLKPSKDRREHDGTYQYSINDYENFLDFGIEQQGEIIQSIHALRLNFENSLKQNRQDRLTIICDYLNMHEQMAAQELPIEITNCSEPAPPVPEI